MPLSSSTPGTPSLLRAINDRAALEVLLRQGPLTRPEIGALTGLSKPTASQLLNRLRDAGLVVLDGIREGGPGRTAELYRINADAGHVAALEVRRAQIRACVADLTGTVTGRFELPTPGPSGGDAVDRARTAVQGAMAEAGLQRVNHVVIGVPGAVDPRTERLGYASHLPGWHIPDLLSRLRDGLGVPVAVENDVNLVAMAELAHGEVKRSRSFVLLWVSAGIGLAIVLDGALVRGATGGAGEVGYMPVASAPIIREPGRANTGGLQAVAGAPAVIRLLREHGFRGGRADQILRRAREAYENGDERAAAGLGELATRLATGLAAIVSVLDPELIVLAGEVPLSGGEPLRALVERELHTMTIPHPPLRLTSVDGNPVLAGGLHLALGETREEIFSSTVR
ncbi:ROK family transcriptional regulator [Actinomadura sp. DC4]|uniref:ROK family transcriptional regulator n=1 Tax=Actinomadura sp. DC4 TaxID=3055069 RepID=UPI0025AFE954|nr:ROK family transcriptional regulator [Actinomadura sp. DC4]MDN3356331.1 ROK family transcriptional regulator [Actinomadura sp. DC4]